MCSFLETKFMANEISTQQNRNFLDGNETETEEFVTFKVSNQLFGVPILQVRDILHLEKIAFIPLAPPHVSGSINLRGQIVTVIDVRVSSGSSNFELQQTSRIFPQDCVLLGA